MSPTCRDCGSEKVGWDKTKAGRHYLRDFGQPHKNTCPAKNGQTAAKLKVQVPAGNATDESGLAENMTEAQVRAQLDAVNQAMQQSGAVKGGKE